MHQFCFAQASTKLFEIPDSVSKVRIWSVGSISSLGTGVTLGVLSKEWYSDYETVPFHFFNDKRKAPVMKKRILIN